MSRKRLHPLLLSLVLCWPRVSPAQLPDIEYLYESAIVRGNEKTRDFFFLNLLDHEPGDRVSVEELDRFRRRLLSTGFFTSVETRLAEGSRPETVVVEIEVEERNTILINDIFFGVSADTPLWGGFDLAEANLLGTGLLLAGAFVASGDQGAVRVNLADPWAALFLPLAWHLEGRYADGVGRGPSLDRSGRPTESAFEYRRIGGRFGIGYHLARFAQVTLDYRIERVDFRHVSDASPLPRTGIPVDSSLLSNLALGLELELRDHPVLPTRGYRVSVISEGGGGFLGSDYEYLRLSGNAEANFWLGAGHVLRLDLSGGSLWARDGRAPFFDGFYVGDLTALAAGRDLELQFTDRRSLDFLDNGADRVTYGEVFGRFLTEWAYGLNPPSGSVGRIEFFVSAGIFGIEQGPWDIGRPAEAVTADTDEELGGFHLDLTLNAGIRADTPVGYFGISVGSALSLAPLN